MQGSDHKWNPKHFQVGTVIAPAHEFYSAGMGRKELRRGALDALKMDEKQRNYAKRSFSSIQATKNSGGKKKFKRQQKRRRPGWSQT